MTGRSHAVRPARGRSPALAVAAAYTAVALLWILFSDRIVDATTSDPAVRTRLQTLKGSAFVTLSGGLVFVLTRHFWRRRLRAEVASRESHRRLHTLIANLPGVVYRARADAERTLEYVSEGCAALTGYTSRDLVGGRTTSLGRLILEDDRPRVVAEVREAVAAGRPVALSYRIRTAGGEIRWLWEQGRPVSAEAGGPAILEGYIADVTDRRRLEQQLVHAQRMEAVGRIASGVAHDFNNLLTAMLGYSELILRRLPPGDPTAKDLEQVWAAGERASILTRQLLGFSRRREAEARVMDLVAVVRSLEPLLLSVAGGGVALATRLPDTPVHVRADPGHVEQVLMNLVVNARDAMPRGGTITIDLARAGGDRPAAPAGDAQPGAGWARLSVNDTGIGMDAATRARIFEPFFTTKPEGKGTGLGLSTVLALVNAAGGHIDVASASGRGATFTIELPLASPPAGKAAPHDGAGRRRRERRSALIVDDDAAVRRLVRVVIERLGHAVTEAGDAEDALAAVTSAAAPFDVVVTDHVMPGQSGLDLAERIRTRAPGTRFLFVSGYDEESARGLFRAEAGCAFLAKPFTPTELADAVSTLLERPAARAPVSA